MEKKQIAILTIVFLLTLFVYFIVSRYFTAKFTLLEKQQQQILSEVKILKKKQITQVMDDSQDISIQDIGKLREKLFQLQNQIDRQSDVLGFIEASPSAVPSPMVLRTNYVSISDRKWPTVDVFQEKNSSSKIVGQAVYGKSYPYLKKDSGYYFIRLSNNVTGWIHNQFVKEY